MSEPTRLPCSRPTCSWTTPEARRRVAEETLAFALGLASSAITFEPDATRDPPVKSFPDAKQRLHRAALARPAARARRGDVLRRAGRPATQPSGSTRSSSSASDRRRAARSPAGTAPASSMTSSSDTARRRRSPSPPRSRAGVERVLLVPGDCPLLDPAELDELLARPPEPPSALIVPDRHGTGTNALLLTPPDALTPSFGPGQLPAPRGECSARRDGARGRPGPVARPRHRHPGGPERADRGARADSRGRGAHPRDAQPDAAQPRVMAVTAVALESIPEIHPGDDLGETDRGRRRACAMTMSS